MITSGSSNHNQNRYQAVVSARVPSCQKVDKISFKVTPFNIFSLCLTTVLTVPLSPLRCMFYNPPLVIL